MNVSQDVSSDMSVSDNDVDINNNSLNSGSDDDECVIKMLSSTKFEVQKVARFYKSNDNQGGS